MVIPPHLFSITPDFLNLPSPTVAYDRADMGVQALYLLRADVIAAFRARNGETGWGKEAEDWITVKHLWSIKVHGLGLINVRSKILK